MIAASVQSSAVCHRVTLIFHRSAGGTEGGNSVSPGLRGEERRGSYRVDIRVDTTTYRDNWWSRDFGCNNILLKSLRSHNNNCWDGSENISVPKYYCRFPACLLLSRAAGRCVVGGSPQPGRQADWRVETAHIISCCCCCEPDINKHHHKHYQTVSVPQSAL